MTQLEDYPFRSTDKLRFGDTDRQGHVNNAAFATFFETGRVELLDQLGILAGRPGLGFVIANIGIDYRREVFWPGTVECGTAVAKIGVSSISLRQSLFQNSACVATAASVVVQVDATTHRSTPLDQAVKVALARLLMPPMPPA